MSNGRSFNFSEHSDLLICRYFAETLYRYAALQTFVPAVHKDAVPFRHSVMSPDGKYTAWTRDCSQCMVDANSTGQASW